MHPLFRRGLAANSPSGKKRPVCATCGRRIDADQPPPFCSEDCRKIDLARWLDGEYRIAEPTPPGAHQPSDEELS